MILEIAEYIGIAAFTASAFYVAKENDLDILGLYIATFITALGGGIIRDVVVGRSPMSMVDIYPGFIVIIVTSALLILQQYKDEKIDTKPLFVLTDAIGMASFAVSGALVAMDYGDFNIFGVAILAFITAVGGGILRDILLNQIPYVLRGGFYGVIAMGIGIIAYALNLMHVPQSIIAFVLLIAGTAIRMYAYSKKWNIPKIG